MKTEKKSNNLTELQKEKMELEIKNLKKPLLARLSFWSHFSPILVALSVIFWSYHSGWFDNQKDLLEIKKVKLEYEIAIFSQQRDALSLQIEILKDSLKIISDKLYVSDSLKTKYINEKDELITRIVSLKKKAEKNSLNNASTIQELDKILKSANKILGGFSNEFSDAFDK